MERSLQNKELVCLRLARLRQTTSKGVIEREYALILLCRDLPKMKYRRIEMSIEERKMNNDSDAWTTNPS